MFPFLFLAARLKVLSKTSRCGVVVRVDDDRAIVQLFRPRGQLIACGSLCKDQGWQQDRAGADRAHEKMSHAAILSQRSQPRAPSPEPLLAASP